MARSTSQHALEFFQRFPCPAKLQQGHTAAIAQFRVVRREMQTRVEAGQRPREIFQRVKRESKAREAVGAVGIGFKRRLEKHQRGIGLAALQSDSAKSMECVE